MAPLPMRIDGRQKREVFLAHASRAYVTLIAIKFLDGSNAGVIGFS